MPVKLTEKAVTKAVTDSAAGKAYDVTDAGAAGLILRAAPRGASWLIRYMWDGSFKRLKLGPVSLIDLTAARSIATSARELLATTRFMPNEHWLKDELLRRRIIEAPPLDRPPPPPPKPTTWTFAEAREEYLAEVKRTLRPATLADRRGMLNICEVAHLAGAPVGTISLATMATIVADIHRTGRERYAGKLAECIRPMWTWLAEPAQQIRSGVLGKPMAELRAPKDTNPENVTGHDDEVDVGTYLPTPEEIGRMLALVRAGVVHQTMADAALLLLLTAQRRRTVVNARAAQFVDEDGVLVWKIPGRFRKTGRTKKGQPKPRSHDLPLPDEAASMVRRRLETKNESGWLFPGIRPRRAGDKVGHLGADSLTHVFADLPGITMSPHDTRRGFTTYLEDLIGLDQQVLKVVLDHSEGKSTRDVTDAHYSKARRLKLKTTILTAWSAFLAEQAAKVHLEDASVIKKAITASRNHRARLSAKNPRPKRVRPPRKKQAA